MLHCKRTGAEGAMTITRTASSGDGHALAYQASLPADGAPLELAPGLFGVRLALPFALDHVNLWLLRDGPGWTVIDAGLGDGRTRDAWDGILGGLLAGRPLSRLIATHFHPDHMGLAGWLCARTGASLWASRTEWLTGRLLAFDESEGFVDAGRAFDRQVGLAPEAIEARAARGNLYRTRAGPPPASFTRVREDDLLTIDGETWRVLIGRGHAPEMICLFSERRNLLIAGDQVLPRISPNIGVWPSEPLADPLADYLASLARFRELPADCLVLPSHGRPFCGLHHRIDALIGHHEERLARTLEACREEATAAAIMPLLFERALDTHQLSFAVGETVAHLNYLVERKAISRRLDDAGALRYRRR
jgi:glyoxylase-like metal-dependent hydrolase (beta-lactamase superfamily II)